MECNMVAEYLYEYIYNELNRDTYTAVKEHLESCGKCRTEYDELKQLLIDNANPLHKLKESIEIPDDLACKAKNAVLRRVKTRPFKYLIAACMTIVLLYTAPVFAYYAASIFPFEQYIGFLDKDMVKEFKEGRGQVIGRSSTMSKVTFTVDGMVKTDDKFIVIFTIKVPITDEYNYGMPVGGFDVITVQDQFGKKYRIGSAEGSNERATDEGEFQYMFEIDEPLSFWSYKLNIRLTAIELGHSNPGENKYFAKYKNIYSDWNVSFYINRSLNRR